MHKTDFLSRLRDVLFLRAHQQTLTWGWTKPMLPTLGGLRVRDKLRLFAEGQVPGLGAILCKYGQLSQCLGSFRGAHGSWQRSQKSHAKWSHFAVSVFSHFIWAAQPSPSGLLAATVSLDFTSQLLMCFSPQAALVPMYICPSCFKDGFFPRNRLHPPQEIITSHSCM